MIQQSICKFIILHELFNYLITMILDQVDTRVWVDHIDNEPVKSPEYELITWAIDQVEHSNLS